MVSISSPKPQILVVGTFHMSPTTDLFSSELDNLSSDRRQLEILEVVERLKVFKPTKVAVEFEKKNHKIINQKYTQYLLSNYELEVNEVYQIGFRVASDLHHNEIYCIDWMEQGAGKLGAGDVYEWAKENQPELFNSIFGWLHGNQDGETRYKTILEMYRDCNAPSEIKQQHTMNINIARIKSAQNYVGMDWLIWWYQRNLIMFSNLSDLITSSDERILLIVGSGHVEILSNFLRESELFEIEPVQKYL